MCDNVMQRMRLIIFMIFLSHLFNGYPSSQKAHRFSPLFIGLSFSVSIRNNWILSIFDNLHVERRLLWTTHKHKSNRSSLSFINYWRIFRLKHLFNWCEDVSADFTFITSNTFSQLSDHISFVNIHSAFVHFIISQTMYQTDGKYFSEGGQKKRTKRQFVV